MLSSAKTPRQFHKIDPMTKFTWTRAGLPVAAALAAWGLGACGFAAEVSPPADSFRQVAAEAVAGAEKSQSMTVPGVGGWLFLDKELRHLIAPKFWASGSGEPQVPGDPLPAILEFKRRHRSHPRSGPRESRDLPGQTRRFPPSPGTAFTANRRNRPRVLQGSRRKWHPGSRSHRPLSDRTGRGA